MGVVEVTLLVLALKIPIVGLLWFVYWAMKEPEPEDPGERKVPVLSPRLPEPGDRLRPRKRGPHSGAARPLPSPRRDPHPAATPPGTVPAPLSRKT